MKRFLSLLFLLTLSSATYAQTCGALPSKDCQRATEILRRHVAKLNLEYEEMLFLVKLPPAELMRVKGELQRKGNAAN
jgi:hypothetical protein